ncbi:MAG: type IV secretion system DNA-binding domain-containing protein, partial [Planctomycetes bacterium]|nr:type IV secretion system DNA-binding domain-containing protein [Planctomycetota bacterium]
DNVHRGQRRVARIPAALRSRHCYLSGASGTGKSTLLLNMILQDIQAGEGVGVLDPHGDLINAVVQRIPEERIDDVILFDPADTEFPFALNLLDSKDEADRERIVSETVMALERYFPSSWGPRLERLLQFTLYTILDAIPGATLADAEQMLTDERFRQQVVGKVHNPRFQQFWHTEFTFMAKNACDPVLNKLSVFLINRGVRNIICQRHSAVDFDDVLNGGKIFLANLSTGHLTERIAGMFGSFLVTKLVNAAFRRARMPEERRRPFYLYIDEFQAFMNTSGVGFERILAEARKYRLVLAGLANQFVAQLNDPVRQAIFGNVGTFVTFRLGVNDANTVAREMGIFTAEEILALELGQAIARAGGSAHAFNIETYPPSPETNPDNVRRIVMTTRQRYARPRSVVEEALTVPPVSAPTPRQPKPKNGKHKPHPEPLDPSEDELVT